MNERLKQLRINSGYTQEQMKTLLGLKYKSHYNQIENGEIRVSLNLARKISKIFKKSIEEIFFEESVHDSRTKHKSIS